MRPGTSWTGGTTVNEDDVRRIVREELVKALQTLKSEASDLDMPYETGALESAGFQAVASAAGAAAKAVAGPENCCTHCGDVLPEHGWNCPNGSPFDGA